MINRRRLFFAILVLIAGQSAFAMDVVVEALLPGVAVVRIDGQRVTLREGKVTKGVRLIEADAKSALIEVEGKTQRLGVSQRISTSFSKPAERVVTIPRNNQMQYLTNAEINGTRLSVLVDTGANIVALNSRHAAAVGIDPSEGQPSTVQTAGSVVPARRVNLDVVDVGGIRINNVAATVIDGEFPVTILLGMSFLQHVTINDSNGVLTLKARY